MKRFASLAAALLAGCSLAPTFEMPVVDVPAQYKELAPSERGNWKTAEPAEGAPRGEWWHVFGDPMLDGLEQQAIAANQTLAGAAARVKQARAIVGVVEADRIPQIGAAFGPYRYQPSTASQNLPPNTQLSPFTVWRGVLTASYEVDLFGRIGDRIAATRSDAAASEATYQSVLLALQADVAQTYFAIRQTDEELRVVREQVELRAESVRIVQRRFDLGDISELDLAQAKTNLALAQNDAIALERARGQLEHGLAVLLGKPPADFALAVAPFPIVPPAIPAGLPSTLLERRPDVATAVQIMAAANSRIGVARAAFFPVLNLTALGGYESAELGDLFKWSSRTWLLGPLFGAILTMPIIDGGRNRSNLDRAYAALEESVAGYRQTVLVAFADVEDNLIALRTLAGQAQVTGDSVGSAKRAFDIANTRYNRGASSFLEVIEAQRSLLVVQQLNARIQGARAISTVALIRSLGGGWDAPVAAAQAMPASEAKP